MKTFLKILLTLFLTLLLVAITLTNIYPVLSEWQWYYYTTKNGKFQFDEFPAKGRNLQMMNQIWEDYKIHTKPADTVIYRTFAKDPLKFWQWRDYFENPRYSYPYLKPADR